MSTYTIDFSKINNHGKNPENSFEDLAFALFKREMEKRGEVVTRYSDKGGDGGVEALSLSGVALQAKYIFTASKTGGLWQQLEKSVCQAYKTYGDKLTEYHIYAPCDLRGQAMQHDGEVEKETTWEHYVKKWTQWFKEGIPANKRKEKKGTEEYEWGPPTPNREIKYVFHGAAELKNALIEPENRNLAAYWFNTFNLSEATLNQKFKEAKAHIDVRYSEANNVDTELKDDLLAFCDSRIYKHKIQEICQNLANRLQAYCNRIESSNIPTSFLNCQTLINLFIPNDSNLPELAANAREAVNDVIKKAELNDNPDSYKKLEKQFIINESEELIQLLTDIEILFYSHKNACRKLLLLDGEAGSGKTHLLASLTNTLLHTGIPTLFIPAGIFYAGIPHDDAIVKYCGFDGTIEELFSYLNADGAAKSASFILIIDALNESPNPQEWKKTLSYIHARIAQLNNIKIIVSCKTEFLDICAPLSIISKEGTLWARRKQKIGVADKEKIIKRYFSAYNISTTDIHQYSYILRTPLIIKLFCETYSNKTIGCEYIGLITFIEKWLEQKCSTISAPECLNISPRRIKKALFALGRKMIEHSSQYLDLDEVEEILEPYSPSQHDSDGLYRQLVANGVLIPIPYNKESVLVTFPYETISNFIILKSDNNLIKVIESGPIDFVGSNPSLVMLCGLIAAKDKREMFNHEMLNNRAICDAFLDGLSARGDGDFNEESKSLIYSCLERGAIQGHLEDIISCSLMSNHPLNAENFTEWLNTYPLAEQELLWTIPLAKYFAFAKQDDTIRSIINISHSTLESFSKEKKQLLIWALLLLCKSNARFLRKKAAEKLSDIILNDHSLIKHLFDALKHHKDHYVYEATYGAVAKMTLRTTRIQTLQNSIQNAAQTYYDLQIHNYVCRRYTEIIIDRCVICKALSEEQITAINKLFHKQTPLLTALSAEDVKALEKLPEWQEILFSVSTEKDGMYGDFGRYIMTYSVDTFSTDRIGFPSHKGQKQYDCDEAKRILLRIIRDLGMNKRIHDNFDNDQLGYINCLGRDQKPIVRIGKKFQEIALNILLASLDDNYALYDSIFKSRDYLDNRLFLQMNDFSVVMGCKKRKYAKCILRSSFKDIVCSMSLEPSAYLEELKNSDFSDIISSNYTENKEDCLLLGGTCFKSHQWVPGYSGIASVFNICIRCWLVKKTEVRKIKSFCKKHNFYGNGFALPQIEGLLALYPKERENDSYAYSEDSWMSKQNGCTALHSCMSLSTHGDSSSILVPSPIISDLLQLAWDEQKSAFIGSSAEIRTYSLLDNSIQAVFTTKSTLLQALAQQQLVPMWAFWYEGYVCDFRTHKRLYDGVVAAEGIYMLDKKLRPQLTFSKDIKYPD